MRRISIEEDGRLMFGIGVIVAEVIETFFSIWIMLTTRGINSFGDVEDMKERVKWRDNYRYIEREESNNQIPEELEVLRKGWFDF